MALTKENDKENENDCWRQNAHVFRYGTAPQIKLLRLAEDVSLAGCMKNCETNPMAQAASAISCCRLSAAGAGLASNVFSRHS